MKQNIFSSYKNVDLRPLNENDLELLRIWRNDANNSKYMQPLKYITSEMQINWFENYLSNSDLYTFSILENNVLNRLVGSVSLYNFNKISAEYGKIMVGDPEAHGKNIGKNAICLCLHIGFTEFNLEKITASVHEKNIPAFKIDQQVGFSVIGRHFYNNEGDELELAISKSEFYKRNPELKNILIKAK